MTNNKFNVFCCVCIVIGVVIIGLAFGVNLGFFVLLPFYFSFVDIYANVIDK